MMSQSKKVQVEKIYLPYKERRKYTPVIPVNNPIELQWQNNRKYEKRREDYEFGRVAVDKQPLPVHDPARIARQSVFDILPTSNKLKSKKLIKNFFRVTYFWKKIIEGRN